MGETSCDDGQRVLVVNDGDQVREITASYVEKLGYPVSTVRDGLEALEILQNDRSVAVLLSDMSMPGMDGEALASIDLPLCIDLDGTLIYSDTLMEGIVALAGDLRLAVALLSLPFTGRAAFKQKIAACAPLEPAVLPYNKPFLAYLEAQKSAGRRLVLATDANSAVAIAIADHLGLFDEIIASDDKRNLKGSAKAAALCARFGTGGFAYAGNAASDRAVWKVARAAVLVNVRPGCVRQLQRAVPIEAVLPNRESGIASLLRAMRPHHWVKNLLVFVPIVTAHALDEASAWLSAALLFAAFCATASAIYLVNDAADLAADRRHVRKRLRPFASGALALPTGLVAACVLGILGLVLAEASGALIIVAAYAVISVGYSFKLKELPLVDVFLLTTLYTIRLFGGGEVTGHRLSFWLLSFSGFLFLGLALLKRVAELNTPSYSFNQAAGRRGYISDDKIVLQTFGCAAAFTSSLVLALFVQQELTAGHYAWPGLLWGSVPLVLFWQCRLWLLTMRSQMYDDPIVYALHDKVSWLIGAAVGLLALLAHFVTPIT